VTVHEYAATLAPRYRAARRGEKGRILDEFCATTGMHRKAAIRLLGWAGPKAVTRSRKRVYGPAVGEALRYLWEVGDRMCGKLLVAAIPNLLTALERHGEMGVSPEVRTALLAISPATVDRLLRPFRLGRRRQPLRASPASPSLKSQVPIRTWGEWKGVSPGSLQADLVLHCGESTEGFYLTTLTAVDVASGWTELQAVWGMGKERIGGALHHVRQRLPFALRELHTDNGSEFINHLLVPWCLRQKISLTRGRSYRKNDQAYVEQKNWLNVRRQVGHDRYNSKAAYAAFQQLYALVRLHVNFFRPVRKLVAKERQGAKLIKRYDQPMTPYQRLLASGALDDAARQALERQFLSLNPAELQRRTDLTLRHLWSTAAHQWQHARKAG
jgi:hypothetical protein